MSIKIKESVDMEHIIQEALKGHPVKLRNGLKTYIRYIEQELDLHDPLIGIILLETGGFHIGEWSREGRWYLNSDYDIVGLWKESLEFNHWDILDKRIKYIAKEANGGWWGFATEPEKGSDYWFTDLDGIFSLFTGIGINIVFPKCNWEDSLIKRPE